MASFRTETNNALKKLLQKNDKVVLIGESIRDPYGGAFKVTRGLTQIADDRIIDMPISESSIIGTGIGMAMQGWIPIIEIMFADFITLGIDQIYNHAIKFQRMIDKPMTLIIRLPSGPGRAYGPTHSQNMEGLLLSIPDVEIWAPSLFSNMEDFYDVMVGSSGIKFVIEDKLLYDQQMKTWTINLDKRLNSNFTVVTYGGFNHIVHDIVLKRENILPFCLNRIKPLPLIFDRIVRGGTVVVVEPGIHQTGLEKDIIKYLHNSNRTKQHKIFSLSAIDSFIPCNPKLEKEIMILPERIESFLDLLERNNDGTSSL
ncbi:MAG: hypothetical protein FK734_14605 [Asgard group archaeon]|nr:hypothetical protein [Asgard group archaeon]